MMKETVSRLEWDERFLAMARLVAGWSKDPSTQVGSVIVDQNNRIVSLGYNGPPRGVKDGYSDRDQKIRRTIHAEKNAASFAKCDLTGCTIYVTHPTCSPCAAFAIQQGIKTVVFYEGNSDFLSRWQEDYDEAMAMYAEAGVEVVVY